MGVKVQQKDGKWYVFINHHGQRKAKCVGDSKKAAEEVKRKLEAKLTLGEYVIAQDKPQCRPSRNMPSGGWRPTRSSMARNRRMFAMQG